MHISHWVPHAGNSHQLFCLIFHGKGILKNWQTTIPQRFSAKVVQNTSAKQLCAKDQHRKNNNNKNAPALKG